MANVYHTVKSGETIKKIASNAKKQHGVSVTWQTIAKLNSLKSPYKLKKGQKLLLKGVKKSSTKPKKATTSKKTSGGTTAAKKPSNVPTDLKIKKMPYDDGAVYIQWKWSQSGSKTKNYRYQVQYFGGGEWFSAADSTTTSTRVEGISISPNATKVRFRVLPNSNTHKVNQKKAVTTKTKKGRKVTYKTTYKTETKTLTYFTGKWSSYKEISFTPDDRIAKEPAVPNVEISDGNVRISLTNVAKNQSGDLSATHVEFNIYVNDENYRTTSMIAIPSSGMVSYSEVASIGSSYKARARSYNDKSGRRSEWSDFSDNVKTVPSAPLGFSEIRATSSTGVVLSWDGEPTAETYEIAYSTSAEGIQIESSSTTSVAGITGNSYALENLEQGHMYFFKIRATNTAGSSSWSQISSIILGLRPDAPTTWSDVTTAVIGEQVIIHWMHNPRDASTLQGSQVEISTGEKTDTITLDGNVQMLDIAKADIAIEEDAEVFYRARTRGVHEGYGEWSEPKIIRYYAQPSLTLSVDDHDKNFESTGIIDGFPIKITLNASPSAQRVVGYALAIRSLDAYETVNSAGEDVTVSEGETVFSRTFSSELENTKEYTLTPADMDLQSGASYIIEATASMSSGLDAKASLEFVVEWSDAVYYPFAEVSINGDDFTAYVKPYCLKSRDVHMLVEQRTVSNVRLEVSELIEEDGSTGYYRGSEEVDTEEVEDTEYQKTLRTSDTSEVIHRTASGTLFTISSVSGYFLTGETTILAGEALEGVLTADGEGYQVFESSRSDGSKIHYVEGYGEEQELVENVSLSVYRRTSTGEFVLIAENLDNTRETIVTDPHPTLDYARYRIVATDNLTGAVSFTDVPGYPIPPEMKSIIIQWDEKWQNFNPGDSEDEVLNPTWDGSLLQLDYDISVSESNEKDVELVNYAGRREKVSYYGTARNTRTSWSCVVPMDDEDVIYALRRLKEYMGDAYVRERSGLGFWASIAVSMSEDKSIGCVKVTLDISRVEGGA